MSNYLFTGYEFSSELKADFKLQNLLQSYAGEEQQMSLKLLNRQSEGFAIGTNTPHGQTPQFVLDQIIGGTIQNIITLDTNTNNLALNFNVDLGSVYKIQNSIEPTNDGDLANKLYVDSLARLRTIVITTNTNALSISKNTDIENPIYNIDLSESLQNLSDLTTNGLLYKTGIDAFDTIETSLIDDQVLTSTLGVPVWKTLNRVTSIGLTTASTGLIVTNTPIENNGNININLSNRLENINNLSSLGVVLKDGTDSFKTITTGSAGQFLGINTLGQLEYQDTGTVRYVGMTTSSGLSVTGSPIDLNGTFDLMLDMNLQNFNNIATDGLILKSGINYSTSSIPIDNGKILRSLNGGVEWITPNTGGNVVGSGASSINSIPKWTNQTCTEMTSSDILVEFNTDLYVPGLIKTDKLQSKSGADLMHYDYGENRVYLDRSLRIPGNGYLLQTSSYGYLNGTGSTGTGSGTNPYSIDCNDRVIASEFNAWSSKKLKNILNSGDAIQNEALTLFKEINYAKYKYKDIVKEGNGEYFGVIAEELKEVAPHFVQDNQIFVPNIYSKGKCQLLPNDRYSIVIKNSLPKITSNKVRIYTENNVLELEILSVSDKALIVKSNERIDHDVFVYGTYEQCPTVAKNKMFELACVVLKNAVHRIEQLENKVNSLC